MVKATLDSAASKMRITPSYIARLMITTAHITIGKWCFTMRMGIGLLLAGWMLSERGHGSVSFMHGG